MSRSFPFPPIVFGASRRNFRRFSVIFKITKCPAWVAFVFVRHIYYFFFFAHRRDSCDGVWDEKNIFLGFIFRPNLFRWKIPEYNVDNCATLLRRWADASGWLKGGGKTATAWLAKAKTFFLCVHTNRLEKWLESIRSTAVRMFRVIIRFMWAAVRVRL